jgi:pimeloyl-ACP methyl ester carboxylesterase
VLPARTLNPAWREFVGQRRIRAAPFVVEVRDAVRCHQSRPSDLVRRLVLVSGAFHHEGLVAGTNEIDVDQVVAAFGASYGEVSPDGEEHYRVVIEKIAAMDLREPTLTASALRGVSNRTLLMSGDDDIVTLEHTMALYRGIPDAELAVVPGTSHFLLQEKAELCNTIVLGFLTADPVPTVAPVRRRGPQRAAS